MKNQSTNLTEIKMEFPSPNSTTDLDNSSTLETKTIAEALSNPTTLTISLLLLLLILVILVGNALICYTIYKTKRFHVSAFIFVFSLAVAGFLVGVFVVPVALVFQVAIEMKEYSIFCVQICDAWIFATTWFSCASIFNLCGISWDRYVAICSPLRYEVRMRKPRIRVMLITIWTVSFCLSVLLWLGVKASKKRIHMCSTEGMDIRYAVFIFIVLFGVPVLFLVFTNCKVMLAARRQLKKIKAQSNVSLNLDVLQLQQYFPSQRNSLQRRFDSLRLGNEIKTFKLFLTVIGVFVLCWLPFSIYTIVSSLTSLVTPNNVKLVFIALTYLNYACNVFVYGFFNKDFRRALSRSVRSKFSSSRPRSRSFSSSSSARRAQEWEIGIQNKSHTIDSLERTFDKNQSDITMQCSVTK